LLIRKKLEAEGLRIDKISYDQWDVIEDKGEQKGEIKGRVRLKNSFASGIDAMIVLELSEVRGDQEEHARSLAFLEMQVQEGEWRLTSIGGGELKSIEDIIGGFAPSRDHSEASAVGSLRTLNTALITYNATYPDVGFAPNLEVLGGNGPQEPSAQHAGLIDDSLASGVKSGYQFHYTRMGKDAYTITARPVEPENGLRSFFTDQTGVIRSTKEDREATDTDDPL